MTQKLSDIISRQVEGGYDDNKMALERGVGIDGDYVFPKDAEWIVEHILAILLDPEGLKAIWPDEKYGTETSQTGKVRAHQILDAWLSGGAEAAIETAHDLLPPRK